MPGNDISDVQLPDDPKVRVACFVIQNCPSPEYFMAYKEFNKEEEDKEPWQAADWEEDEKESDKEAKQKEEWSKISRLRDTACDVLIKYLESKDNV